MIWLAICRCHAKDGKGYISAADIRPAVTSLFEMVGNDELTDQEMEEIVEAFYKADTDGDGKFSYQGIISL